MEFGTDSPALAMGSNSQGRQKLKFVQEITNDKLHKTGSVIKVNEFVFTGLRKRQLGSRWREYQCT